MKERDMARYDFARYSDHEKMLPIHIAAEKGDFEHVKRLYIEDPECLTKFCQVHDTLPIHHAAHAGHSEIVKWMIEQDPSLLRSRQLHGETCLHLAAMSGNLELCKWLVTQDLELLYIPNCHNALPIHLTHHSNVLAIIQYFAQQDPMLLYARGDWYDIYPIHLMAYYKQSEALKWMVSKDPLLLKRKDENDDTPLYWCRDESLGRWMVSQCEELLTTFGKGQIIPHLEEPTWTKTYFSERLKDEGSGFIHKPNSKRQLPIHCAAILGDIDFIKQVIKIDPSMLDAKDNDKNIALHLLMGREDNDLKEFIQWLVNQDHSQLKVKNCDGQLPFFMNTGFWAGQGIIEWILELDPVLLSEKDDLGRNILHYLARKPSDHKKCLDFILAKESNLLKSPDIHGNLPVHIALQTSNFQTAKWMLEKDLSLLHIPGHWGKPPIHLCYDLDLTKWMLEKDPNLALTKDSHGELPVQSVLHRDELLHRFDDHKELIKYLLDHMPEKIKKQPEFVYSVVYTGEPELVELVLDI